MLTGNIWDSTIFPAKSFSHRVLEVKYFLLFFIKFKLFLDFFKHYHFNIEIIGMSGAQAKAATISRCIGIVAEVSHFIKNFFSPLLCMVGNFDLTFADIVGQLRRAKETLRSRLGPGND
jgi:hypothetical protein